MRKGNILLVLLLVACASKPVVEMPTSTASAQPIYIPPTSTTSIVPTSTKEVTEDRWVFPYFSQEAEDAPYKEDCSSVCIKMVTNFYGIEESRTIKDIHDDMVGGDYPVDFRVLDTYIKEHYKLDTRIITTYEPIIPMLEEIGFDTSDIEYVHGIPMETPVIWIYLEVPHWTVRYAGYSFDPEWGIRKFRDIDNIYRPDYGLGIIVDKAE